MKLLFKFFLIILCFSISLLSAEEVFAKENKVQYKQKNISNYFSGIISLKQHDIYKAYKYLNKVEKLKESHTQFNVEFIKTLVLTEKFEQAFSFSKSIWNEDELFFEIDLLLGLNYFIKEDYKNAEKHFERLDKISRSNLIFDNFFGNILISWIRANEGNKIESFNLLKKIPKKYDNLTKIQDVFLKCYYNNKNTQSSFVNLLQNENYNFSRYNFFLINYLLSQDKNLEAKKIAKKSSIEYNQNLLIKQTKNFLINKKNSKIKDFFNCKNPKDSIAEFFYIIANLYASEHDYQTSNFYLKISLFLNKKFITNKALLAENFYYQKKNELAKEVYYSLKPVGSIYSWYSEKNISTILEEDKGKKHAVKNLEKELSKVKNKNFEHYYDMANFYKNNKYFLKSIEYYSLALENIKKEHSLLPIILYRRGTCYERLDDWQKAEKDFNLSLKILPDQAHVLNYLAYTWIDKGVNLDRGLEMLIKANKLKKNDSYIIDSLGWAYYVKKNYEKAEFFLKRAVQLSPTEPIINDHYADALWMLNKKIQARYVWDYVYKLKDSEKELKDVIRKKLIFGITKEL